MRVDDATQETKERVGSWTGAEAVGGWRAERQAAEGSLRLETTEELVAGEQRGKQQKAVCGWRPRRSWWLESREKAVETGQERGEQRGWRGSTEGQSTPDTRTERRGDKIGSSEEESQDV